MQRYGGCDALYQRTIIPYHCTVPYLTPYPTEAAFGFAFDFFFFFPPVPFTGCLRAYRFHFTSPLWDNEEISHVLDVFALRQVGLVLNAGNTKILTTQNQHPAEPVSPGGIVVEILERDRAHKWLGCMISTHTDGSHGLDLEHHLQAASRVFYANKSILFDKSVSIAQRLAYFDAMVTPVACFASGHRKIYKQDLRKLDVKFRKLVRTIVGPPGGLDWSAPWHHILHEWNARVLECAEQTGVKLWSRRCLEQHGKLASYIANLSDNRWLKRALAWTARRRTRIGRPTNTWDAQIQMYCRWQNLGEWRAAAMQTDFWLTHMDSFIEFLTPK